MSCCLINNHPSPCDRFQATIKSKDRPEPLVLVTSIGYEHTKPGWPALVPLHAPAGASQMEERHTTVMADGLGHEDGVNSERAGASFHAGDIVLQGSIACTKVLT